VEVSVDSRLLWVDTEVVLEAGKTYRLRASGRWHDASIDTDAAGYSSVNTFQRWTEGLRRAPAAPWFSLIGAIDRRRDTQFIIGTECTWRAPASGRLTCFANDVRGFYFNNSGSITLAVEPIS
jgi:hypothetical protein